MERKELEKQYQGKRDLRKQNFVINAILKRIYLFQFESL